MGGGITPVVRCECWRCRRDEMDDRDRAGASVPAVRAEARLAYPTRERIPSDLSLPVCVQTRQTCAPARDGATPCGLTGERSGPFCAPSARTGEEVSTVAHRALRRVPRRHSRGTAEDVRLSVRVPPYRRRYSTTRWRCGAGSPAPRRTRRPCRRRPRSSGPPSADALEHEWPLASGAGFNSPRGELAR